MLLTLRRYSFTQDGIFGMLYNQDGGAIASTLEHAYEANCLFRPKLPDGEYTCQRGMHQLLGMTAPFETFEIMNVPGHAGILFHVGNYNADSNGCVLLGTSVCQTMLINSKMAFQNFMCLLDGQNTFDLIVK